MLQTIRAMISRALTPTYDQLVNQSTREMHQFHLLKYKNFDAANKHRKRAIDLQAQARAMKGQS